MRADHLPDPVEVVPADPECLLAHLTLAAVSDGHFENGLLLFLIT